MGVDRDSEISPSRSRWTLWDLDLLSTYFPLNGEVPDGRQLDVLAEETGHSAQAVRRQWRALAARIRGTRVRSSALVETWFATRLAPRRVYLGIVPVDSGAILISDPGYVLKRDGAGGVDYNEFLNGLDRDPLYIGDGLALVVMTGGDFVFPVYAEYSEGEVQRVVIDLNPSIYVADAYWREHLDEVARQRTAGEGVPSDG